MRRKIWRARAKAKKFALKYMRDEKKKAKRKLREQKKKDKQKILELTRRRLELLKMEMYLFTPIERTKQETRNALNLFQSEGFFHNIKTTTIGKNTFFGEVDLDLFKKK